MSMPERISDSNENISSEETQVNAESQPSIAYLKYVPLKDRYPIYNVAIQDDEGKILDRGKLLAYEIMDNGVIFRIGLFGRYAKPLEDNDQG